MNPYIKIMRPSIFIMSAFGALVGALVAGVFSPLVLFYVIMAVLLISAAGIVINDYYDVETDRINAPHRPIPSGKISPNAALYFSLALFMVGIFFAFLINIFCLALALLNVFLEILYARNLKQVAVIGNITDSWFVASTFIFGALVNLNFGIVWILALLAFLANVGREIIGDVEDIKGDKKIGLKTLPIITSEGIAMRVGQFFILCSIFLSFWPVYIGLLGMNYFAVVMLANILFAISLFQSPRKNQKTTKLAMFIALIAFLIGVLF